MRERLKKPIAIIMGVILVLTLIVTPMDVRATYIDANGYTVVSNETLEITADTTDEVKYQVNTNGILKITNAARVHSLIEVNSGGKIIIDQGAYAADIRVGTGATVENKGTLSMAELYGGTLENYGKVESAYSSPFSDICTINNYTGGEIGDISGESASIYNGGLIESVGFYYGTCTLDMKAGSQINELSISSTNAGFSEKITSEEGAVVKRATIKAECVDLNSSGTMKISESLKLDGSIGVPITIEVTGDTKITTNTAYSGWSVSYNGSSYLLPNKTVSYTTLPELYSVTPSKTTIAL